MIGRLGPYPAHKDSGVDWLGEVPEEWSLVPLVKGYRQAKTLNKEMVERTVLSLSYGRIVVKPDDQHHGLTPESFETYQLVTPGDILIRATDMQNDQRSLRVAAAGRGGIITAAYLRLIVRPGLTPRFGYLLLHAYDLMKVLYGYGSGLRQTLDFDEMKRIPIAFPSLEEQAAIVRFVDHADAQIERFTTAKEQLIKLLQEERKAVVHGAVRRGLNPDVTLEPSGVQTLGDVPAHWRVARVKNEFRSLDHLRRPLAAIERELRRGPYDYYGASGVIDKVDDYIFDEDLLLIAEDGANLVLRGSPLAFVARGRYWVNNHAHILKPLTGDLDFMASLMESLDYRPYISGAAQPKLTQDRLFSIPLAVPPVAEQKQIARGLSEATVQIDRALGIARRQIDLLREYRIRLVSDVATGKLDVREAARALPDDPDVDDPALGEVLEEVVAA